MSDDFRNHLAIVDGSYTYDQTLDGHGPTIDLTWRQYGELIRLLDRAVEFEDEAGWSTRALRNMADLLVAKARESSKKKHPSNYQESPS